MPTAKLGLETPAAGTRPWDALILTNWNNLEARLTTQFAGNPNTNVAGFWVGQWCYDTTNNLVYICTTATGAAGTSVWAELPAHIAAQLTATEAEVEAGAVAGKFVNPVTLKDADITRAGRTIEGKRLRSTAIITAAISSDQNNYNPAGFADAGIVRLNVTADCRITGLLAGVDGDEVELHNVGTNTVILDNEDAASTAANRFTSSLDFGLRTKLAVRIRYDGGAVARWRILRELVRASKADQQNATSEIPFVSPLFQHEHDLHPKARFLARVPGGSLTLHESVGISGIVRIAAGRFRADFSAAFANTDYYWELGVSQNQGSVLRWIGKDDDETTTASSFPFCVVNSGGAFVDPPEMTGSFSGRLA